MAGVTVYDRHTLRSTTTDQNGYYELPVTPQSQIVVSKLDYRDTVLQVSSQTPRFVKLDLYPDSLPQPRPASLRDQVNRTSYALEEFFLKTSQQLSALNVQDSLHRRFQFSLLPNVGTNQRLSGSVTNDISINLLAGYSRGNRVLELAGLGNLTRENMTGLQAAGVFNNLRGNAAGFQAAGVYNYVGDTLTGVQAAGVVNVAGYGHKAAFQAAGALNLVPRGRFGIQVAGAANLADTITAFQAAGAWNSARVFLNGAQVAGAINHAGRADAGTQFAGLTNSVGRGVIRAQVAGLGNVADTLNGIQVAGLFNRARCLRGTQIGVINFAGVNRGTQIGLLNFSRQGGYMAVEASVNDLLWANLAFHSGTRRLYVTLTAGVDSAAIGDRTLWAFGVGVGTRTRLAARLGLSADLVHRHLNEGGFDNAVREWEQLAVALQLRIAGGLYLSGGPTFNLLITDPDDADSPGFRSRTVKKNVLPGDAADGWLSGWWGWTAGVKWAF